MCWSGSQCGDTLLWHFADRTRFTRTVRSDSASAKTKLPTSTEPRILVQSGQGRNMKILVTGGLGAVGRWLVPELRRRGHEVWMCDLAHHHDSQYTRCDVSEYRQLERVFERQRFDLVYHLAAEFGRWNGEDFYETLWRSNVIGTK